MFKPIVEDRYEIIFIGNQELLIRSYKTVNVLKYKDISFDDRIIIITTNEVIYNFEKSDVSTYWRFVHMDYNHMKGV